MVVRYADNVDTYVSLLHATESIGRTYDALVSVLRDHLMDVEYGVSGGQIESMLYESSFTCRSKQSSSLAFLWKDIETAGVNANLIKEASGDLMVGTILDNINPAFGGLVDVLNRMSTDLFYVVMLGSTSEMQADRDLDNPKNGWHDDTPTQDVPECEGFSCIDLSDSKRVPVHSIERHVPEDAVGLFTRILHIFYEPLRDVLARCRSEEIRILTMRDLFWVEVERAIKDMPNPSIPTLNEPWSSPSLEGASVAD